MASGSIKAILDLRAQLESKDSARNASYDECVKYYSGTDLRTAKRQGFLSGVTAILTSIFSPPAEEEDPDTLRTPINVIKGAVENKVAFLALPPTVRVIEPPDSLAPGNSAIAPSPLPTATGVAAAPASPLGTGGVAPPTPSPSAGAPPGPASLPGIPAPTGAPEKDWGIDLADRLEMVLKSLMDFSNMPKRCRDVAWSLCVMDGAIIGVWPDSHHGKPRIFTRTPQDFYPVSRDPDGLELTKAVWVEYLNGNDIEARWGNSKYLGKDDVKVTFYIDEVSFCTVLDDKEWAHPPVENTVGFVPIVCVGSLGMPGMIFGGNDVKDAIPIAKEINYHLSLVDSQAKGLTNPTVVINNADDVSRFVALGEGGVITTRENGGVSLIGPMPLPNGFWQLGGTLQNWLDIVMDNPAVLRGESGSSIVTGKGFNSQLGPIAARMQTRLEIIMSGWRQVLKYTLMMWASFPGMDSKITASGSLQNETFYIEAKPEDFLVNGKIWTEIEVFLQAQSYIDRQGNSVELMQLYQNELLDWETCVNNMNLGGNLDRRRIRANIDRDRQWKAEGMATAQAAAQSVMTANAPLGNQEKTNYALERGLMGETGAPSGPEAQMAAPAPETANSAPSGPSEATDTGTQLLEVMKEFFSSIDKLRGSVWFGGDPVSAPEKFASDMWRVKVWVTDPIDKATIVNASRGTDVEGHIDFINGQPAPDEQAIQVAGGGGGPANVSPDQGVPSGVPDLSLLGGAV